MTGGGEQGDDLIELDVGADRTRIPCPYQQGVESLAETRDLAVDAHVHPAGGEQMHHGAGAGRVLDDLGEEREQRGGVALGSKCLGPGWRVGPAGPS